MSVSTPATCQYRATVPLNVYNSTEMLAAKVTVPFLADIECACFIADILY